MNDPRNKADEEALDELVGALADLSSEQETVARKGGAANAPVEAQNGQHTD